MKNELFEEAPIPKAVATLAIPTIIGMLVVIIYNMADTFFVGQLNNPDKITAVTMTMPVFMCLMSFGSIFGIGGGSFISRLLGQKDGATAKKVSAVSFYSSLFIGVICIGLGLLFLSPLLNVLGTDQDTYQSAKDYLLIIILGAPAIILSFSMGQVIRSEGSAKVAMLGMMLGTVINIVLDPILILTLHMDVAGAAYATVFSNVVSVLFYIHYFIKKSPNLSILPKHFALNGTIYKNILMIGIPASLNTILMSFSNIILNNYACLYGNNVVAALGVISKITMVPVMLIIGLCQGVQPLIGYNYASGNRKRMISIIKFTGIAGTVIGVISTVLIYFVGGNSIKAFINDAEVIEMGARFLRINMLSVPFMGIMFLFINVFQAMGKGGASLVLSISRQGLIFIPTIIIANSVFGLNGIVYAQPIADIASTLLSVFLFFLLIRKPEQQVAV